MSTDVLIYCNGDSFVNGYELGDDYITGHPGYYDYSASIDIAHEYNYWYSNTFDINTDLGKERDDKSKQIFAKQADLAFPNIIHKKTGLKVINAATKYTGNSQASISRNTITDLYELKKEYKKIVAIIGTTSVNRLYIPNENGTWHNIMLGYKNREEKNHYANKLKGFIDFYHHYYTEYHLYIEWLKNVILVKAFCESNDIPLLWTTGIYPAIHEKLPDEPDLKAFVDVANIYYDVNLVSLAKEIDKNVMCPGYHFSHIVHEQAAQLFIDKIDKLI